MATKPLTIGYSGSLAFYEGDHKPVRGGGMLRNWFWTYNHIVTDPSTRSASFLFRAISELRKKHTITAADLTVQLWGRIDPLYLKQAEELKIADLLMVVGYLSKSVSIARTDSCDVLFLPMESGTIEGKPLFIPGKAYEYMNAGKPVLALSSPCDCMTILEPTGLLARFEPVDYDGISDWLWKAISDRSFLESYRPNAAYIEQYSFRKITQRVAGVFDEVLGKKA